MKGTFGAGLDRLKEQVGTGHITGQVEVDQVYAHYQHEHPEFKHPQGGKAFYLRDPLFTRGTTDYMHRLADRAITENGSAIRQAMVDNMEDLSMQVYFEAPWEFGDLRASGHPSCRVNDEVYYDRAPNCPRLSTDDLRIKHHLRYLGF